MEPKLKYHTQSLIKPELSKALKRTEALALKEAYAILHVFS